MNLSEFKQILRKRDKSKILLFFQEDIIKKNNLLTNEVFNKSLFWGGMLLEYLLKWIEALALVVFSPSPDKTLILIFLK